MSIRHRLADATLARVCAIADRCAAARLFSVRVAVGSGTIPVLEGYAKRVYLKTHEAPMNGLIYLIGLIVVIMAILSFLGLH
jgi:hypothetical protein